MLSRAQRDYGALVVMFLVETWTFSVRRCFATYGKADSFRIVVEYQISMRGIAANASQSTNNVGSTRSISCESVELDEQIIIT